MNPRSLASSQTGRRGQEVRHASITSKYGFDSAPIHSSKSSIRASTGSDNAASLAAICVLELRIVGILGERSTQAALNPCLLFRGNIMEVYGESWPRLIHMADLSGGWRTNRRRPATTRKRTSECQ